MREAFLFTWLLLLSSNSYAQSGLSFEWQHSSESLDVFDYAESIESKAKFKEENSFKIHGLIQLNEKWALTGRWHKRDVSATRSREPLNLELLHQGFGIGIERTTELFKLSLKADVINYSNQRIEKYQYGQVVLGEDIKFINPQTKQIYPLIEYKQQAFSLSSSVLFPIKSLSGLSWGGGYQWAQIKPTLSSPLLDIKDKELLQAELNGHTVEEMINELMGKLPQNTQWFEHTLSLRLNYGRALSKNWYFNTQLSSYYLLLQQYEGSTKGKYNLILESKINYKISMHSEFYISGQLSSNYVLGLYPGIYNEQSAFLFEHPYALIGIGIDYKF